MADAGSRNPTSGGIGQLTHFHEMEEELFLHFSCSLEKYWVQGLHGQPRVWESQNWQVTTSLDAGGYPALDDKNHKRLCVALK